MVGLARHRREGGGRRDSDARGGRRASRVMDVLLTTHLHSLMLMYATAYFCILLYNPDHTLAIAAQDATRPTVACILL